MEEMNDVKDLRKTVRYNERTYKEKLTQVIVAMLSWVLWVNIAWAVIHFRSFSKFWSFLGF